MYSNSYTELQEFNKKYIYIIPYVNVEHDKTQACKMLQYYVYIDVL
mgnify:CR=1 FL=1